MKQQFNILSVFILWAVSVVQISAQCPSLPFCKFTYTIASDGFTVVFDGETSCQPMPEIKWDFGDGDISSGNGVVNPTHIYSQDGTYVVKMTVNLPAPNTGCVHTHTQTIVITAGTPTAMWLDLTGPTIAIECQQVTYTANVVGGVPPYTYKWDFLGYYCPACNGMECTGGSGMLTGGPSQAVRFDNTGNSTATFIVTVTDGRGATVSETMNVKVKDAFANIEIKAIAEKASCGSFGVNSNILFSPDISPLSTFEYPTDYFWTFGDGTSEADRHDGGGVVLKKYTEPGNHTYTVTLNVCDPNGCMQTSKQISVCDPNGGGGGSANCALVNAGSSEETVILDYVNGGYPSVTQFEVINLPTGCFVPNTTWTGRMESCDFCTLPYPPFPSMNGTTPLPGTLIELSLFDSWWQSNKPWGCLSLTGSVSSGGNGCTNCSPIKNCIAYIMPDELEITDFLAEGSCRDYTLTALIKGGGWKKSGNKFIYKEVIWKAYDTNSHELELTGVLVDVAGSPEKKRVNLDHPYFQQFGPNQFVEFMVKVTVNDFANGSVETNQLVAFNPFRLHLKDHYDRCPGLETQFSLDPLATGGSDDLYPLPYTFTWSPSSLTGENPTFIAPAAGATATYAVTVTLSPGCSLSKTTTVTGKPLNLVMGAIGWACSGQGIASIIKIGPYDLSLLGGSGEYGFEWQTANPADLAYLSDISVPNPTVLGIPAGQTITYTLVLSDLMAQCTATASVQILGVANDLSLNLSGPASVCYGTEALLQAQGLPAPTGWAGLPYYYAWSTDNRNHPGVASETYNTLPITALASSYPGIYKYTVRYTNRFTGCYTEKEMNVTVRENWTHVGYVPEIGYAQEGGSSVSLWKSYTDNRIIEPNPFNSSTHFSVTWSPFSPTSIENNGGTSHGLVPKNGQFLPTRQSPQLTMSVTEATTGCTKKYKTQRYIITSQKPEVWVAPEETSICINDNLCFDVVFDMHVADYQTSWLPATITANYVIKPPEHSQQIPQPFLHGTMELKLVNSSGLYKGNKCIEGYFIQKSLPSFQHRYLFQVKHLSSNTVPVGNEVDYTNASIWINVLERSTKPSFSGCTLPSGYFYQITLGVPSCNGTKTMSTGYQQSIIAGNFIDIKPDEGIEIFAVNKSNGAPGTGHHLFISECITEQPPPAALESQNTEQEPEELGKGLTLSVSESPPTSLTPSTITLEVFPNPFTGQVTIRYTVPPDCPGDVALHLRDFTGRQIKTLERRANAAPGAYQSVFDGSGLPTGIYLYELVVCNGAQVVKKAEKISH